MRGKPGVAQAGHLVLREGRRGGGGLEGSGRGSNGGDGREGKVK